MPTVVFLPSRESIACAYAVEVAAQLRIIVVGRLDWNILPMIAEIEHQHIVVRRELLPEWQVGVGRKAVAVGDREAHAIAIAVPPDANARAILQDDIKRLARHRNDEIHSLALRYSDCAATRRMDAAVGSRFACPRDHLYYRGRQS